MTFAKGGRTYDLEERTVQFGEFVIEFSRKIPKDPITQRLIPQLVGAATAVGANYCEADCAESSKDFVHKISIANKEAKETKHFARMLAKAYPSQIDDLRKIWKEAHELNSIFSVIIKKTKETQKRKAIFQE